MRHSALCLGALLVLVIHPFSGRADEMDLDHTLVKNYQPMADGNFAPSSPDGEKGSHDWWNRWSLLQACPTAIITAVVVLTPFYLFFRSTPGNMLADRETIVDEQNLVHTPLPCPVVEPGGTRMAEDATVTAGADLVAGAANVDSAADGEVEAAKNATTQPDPGVEPRPGEEKGVRPTAVDEADD
jgi:hypothetical protein